MFSRNISTEDDSGHIQKIEVCNFSDVERFFFRNSENSQNSVFFLRFP